MRWFRKRQLSLRPARSRQLRVRIRHSRWWMKRAIPRRPANLPDCPSAVRIHRSKLPNHPKVLDLKLRRGPLRDRHLKWPLRQHLPLPHHFPRQSSRRRHHLRSSLNVPRPHLRRRLLLLEAGRSLSKLLQRGRLLSKLFHPRLPRPNKCRPPSVLRHRQQQLLLRSMDRYPIRFPFASLSCGPSSVSIAR